jgi:hypothetical protein
LDISFENWTSSLRIYISGVGGGGGGEKKEKKKKQQL